MQNAKSGKIDGLIFVADLHCGSSYGLIPDKFITHEGTQIGGGNILQRWLWDCWQEDVRKMREWTRGRNVGLVILGDAVEGIHHRTTEVVSADSGDHVGIAIEVLRPLRKLSAKAWIVEGTECHTRNAESSIGDALDCEPFRPRKGADCGVFSWPELPLEVNGCYGIARHHITTTSRPHLEAGGLGIQMNMEVLEASRSGAKRPRWLAYAHRHREGYVCDGDTLAIVCAPWQGLTRHGRKVVGSARYVKPGMAFMDFADLSDGLPTIRRTRHAPHSQAIVRA